MNVIEYFSRVEIVNMVSRQDRRDETMLEFANNDFPINTDTIKFFEAVAPNTAEGFPNIGARGCFLSHMNIMEKSDQAQLDNLLVLEDDVAFSKDIKEYGALAINALDNMEWDIAYLGHTLDISDTEAVWRKVSEPMQQSHFYAVNGRSIRRLYDFLNQMQQRPAGHPDGGPMHYDGALNTFIGQNPDIKAYYFSKNLGYQRPSKTDIHQPSFIDRYTILKPLSALFRKLKRGYFKAVR